MTTSIATYWVQPTANPDPARRSATQHLYRAASPRPHRHRNWHSTRGSRLTVLAIAVATLLVASTGSAQAKLSGAAPASAAYTSATLAGPTGLSITKACSTSSTVTLKWTATSSAYAAGYLLTYTQNGAAGTPQTITGKATITMTYPITNGASYVVTLSATYRNWTSQTNPTTAPFNC